jgi:tetratricopeptide (TPR) repeat protein
MVRRRLTAEVPDAHVLELRGREALGGAAGGTVHELMRLALELPIDRPADGGRKLLAERLGPILADELWAGVAVTMGWVDAGDPAVRAVAAAPGALRAGAARAIGLALRRCAASRPLLLFVDDAHLADAASLDAIETATLEEGAAAVWACLAARPALLETRANLGRRAGAFERIELGPLDDVAGERLCRELLLPAEDIPRSVIAQLLARTHGVPLVLVELARSLIRDGRVRRHAKGGTHYLASDGLDVPDTPLVEWLASRELGSLAPELARHARLCALLGAAFAREEVAGVLDELDRAGAGADSPLDASVGNGRLADAGLVVATAERGRWAFRGTALRDAIRESTPLPLAAAIHQAAFDYYRRRNDAASRAALAFHAGRAGHLEESFAAYHDLARAAEAGHAYLDAEVAYSRALELRAHAGGAATEAAALRGRGLMRFRLFRYDEALKDFEAARVLADERTRLSILLDEATVLDFLFEWPRMSDTVDHAVSLAAELSSGPGAVAAARLTFNRGRVAYRFSRDADAARLLMEAAAAAATAGDDSYETYETTVVSLLMGGAALSNLARFDDAEAAFARVLPMVSARGDHLHVAAVRISRFGLWAARNQYTEMRADLEEALRICREIGIPHLENMAQQTLAFCLHWMGRSMEAEEHARRAIAVDERIMGESARMEGRVFLARLLALRGDAAGADEALSQIQARLDLARAKGLSAVELVPGEEVGLDFARLLVHGGSPEAWAGLAARASRYLTGQDLAEVIAHAARHTAAG